MRVTVRTIGPFTEQLGFHQLKVTLQGNTVEDLLQQLCKEQGPHFRNTVFDEEGRLRRYIKLLVNGRGLHVQQGLHTTLSEGDIIAIFPPVAGGVIGILR